MTGPYAWMATLVRRMRFHLRRDHYEREIAEELQMHLELKARDYRHAGMSADEARGAARRQVGNVGRMQEEGRDVFTIQWMDAIGRDLRFAWRSLRRTPAFSLVAVASLTLGIGVATAVFTLANAMLLKPLPWSDAGRLVVSFQTISPGVLFAVDTMPWSYGKYVQLREAVPALESSGFATWEQVNLRVPGRDAPAAERVRMEFVTAGVFTTLGVRPVLGRGLEAADVGPVAVISHRLWRRLFNADVSVIGQSMRVGEATAMVIGVMPPSFTGFRDGAEFWMPLESLVAMRANRPGRPFDLGFRMGVVVARVRQGTSLAAANAQVAAAAREMNARSPEPFGRADAVWSGGLLSLGEARRHPLVEPLIAVFAIAAAGLLLIVCANVGGLLVARARARRGEMGVRIALGAGQGRLVRQLLAESLLLAALGAVPGVVLGNVAATAVARMRPDLPSSFILLRDTDLLRDATLSPDWRVAAFGILLTVAVAMLFGMGPALAATREGISGLLTISGGSRGTSRGRGRRTLVVTQVAVATTLLVGAGLTIRSFQSLVRTDLGFDPERLVMMRVSSGESGAAAASRRADYLARIEALPGVAGVAMHNCLPLSGSCSMAPVSAVDDRRVERGELPPIEVHVVSRNYLAVAGTALLAGRTLDEDDAAGRPGVVLVNQAAARLLWPGQSPLGRRLVASMDVDAPPSVVVGVVADTRFDAPDQPVRPAVYVRAEAAGEWPSVLLVRTRGEPERVIPVIRSTMTAVDPGAALHDVTTGRALVAKAASSLAFISTLLTAFGVSAALLAAMGVYGVLAYMVTQRTREFGIRMAIGASRASVQGLVVRQGAWLTLAGLAAGVVISLSASQLLARFLYGVERGDLVTYGSIVVLIGLLGPLAAFLPARRATRVDPVLALRE